MKKTITIFIQLLAALLVLESAGAVTLNATVDRNQVTLEDQILYTLKVEGAQDANPPNLPAMNDFHVQQGGTSTQMSIINGVVSRSVQYNYSLIPKKSGKFLIGPSTLNYQGKTIKSRPIEIIVLQPGRTQSNASGGQGAEDVSKGLFARVSVSKNDPFENEQIVYTFKLYRRIDIANASLEFPKFTGFWAEELGKQSEYRENVNGVSFHVTEIKKALFPSKAGNINVESALLQCDVLVKDPNQMRRDPFGNFFNDPFFDQAWGRQKRVRKNIRSNELEIQVKPLPAEGRPKGFNNLVGNFSISATMEKNELEAGDTNTITVIVEGDGNVRDADIQIPANKEDFKLYDDKPEVEIDRNGTRLMGRKTFKKAYVPLKEGVYDLSRIEISYFNPGAGKYQTINASLSPMRVTAPREKEKLELLAAAGPKTEKKKVEIIGKDIFPIATEPKVMEQGLSEEAFRSITAVLFGLPTLMIVSSFLVVRRREKRLSGAGVYRFKGAYSQAKKKFKALNQAAGNNNGRDVFTESSKIFKDYIGDKLNIPGGSLTPTEVGDLLEKKGVDKKFRALSVNFLEKCEAGQFARLDTMEDNYGTVLNEVQQVMKGLEKEIRI